MNFRLYTLILTVFFVTVKSNSQSISEPEGYVSLSLVSDLLLFTPEERVTYFDSYDPNQNNLKYFSSTGDWHAYFYESGFSSLPNGPIPYTDIKAQFKKFYKDSDNDGFADNPNDYVYFSEWTQTKVLVTGVIDGGGDFMINEGPVNEQWLLEGTEHSYDILENGNTVNTVSSNTVYFYQGNHYVRRLYGFDCDSNNSNLPLGIEKIFVDKDNDGFGDYENIVTYQEEVEVGLFMTMRANHEEYKVVGCAYVSPYNVQYVYNDLDCNDFESAITTQSVNWYVDNDGDGFGNPNEFILSCRRPLDLNLDYVLNSEDCDDNDFRYNNQDLIWYADFDDDGFGDENNTIVSPCPPNGDYIRDCYFDECPTVAGTRENGCPLVQYDFDNANQNYTYERDYLEEYKPEELNSGIPIGNVFEQIRYTDGIGRVKQYNSIGASPLGKDLILHYEYDGNGQELKSYLPYASIANNGMLDQNSLSNTLAFYDTPKYENTTNPYSEYDLENSPIGKAKEIAAPGSDWAIDTQSDNDHTIKQEYGVNSQNEVINFDVIFPTGIIESPQLFYNGNYNANDLYKTTTKDENWSPSQSNLKDHTTEEFVDKEGFTVLTRTFNNSLEHDTYYIYDDLGNLTYTLSPKGSDNILTLNKYKDPFSQTLKAYQFLEQNSNGSPVVGSSGYVNVNLDNINETLSVDFNISFVSSAELLNGPIALLDGFVPDVILGTVNQSGASYIISVQNNFIHISGSGLINGVTDNFIVNLPTYSPNPNVLDDLCYQYKYDYRNRLIEKKIPAKGWEYIVYDKLDRPVLVQEAILKQANEWLFTKYDNYNRPIYTGKLLNIDDNRSQLQDKLDTETVFNEDAITTTTNIAGTVLNYTNQVYPTQDVIEILSISYYDNYNFDHTGLTLPNTNNYGIEISSVTEALPTGSKVKVLDTNEWVTALIGYDDRARAIYVTTKNDYLNTTDTVESDVDFVGKVLQSKTTHSKTGQPSVVTINDFAYDHAGRLLSQKQEIIGLGQERIAENYYDELGQLEKKDVGGETVFEGYTDFVGVEVEEISGDVVITKTGNNGWNSGLATKGKFLGDGYVEWTVPQSDKHIMVGLSPINVNENYNTLMYAITYSPGGHVGIREDTDTDGINEYIAYYGIHPANTKFKIERSGSQIKYYKNDESTPFHTSNVNAYSGSLLGDASFNTSGGKIKNFTINSANLNTVLQTIDYAYNIRGWLKGINDIDNIGEDLFTLKLSYNTPEHTNATPLYNGNISETKWQTYNDYTDGVDSRSYFYEYDALNRITKGVFSKVGGSVNQNGFYNLNQIDYDKNGNIGVLRRKGVDDSHNAINGYMDDLSYAYNGNQLKDIKELGNNSYGFKEVSAPSVIDYTYDDNGNMVSDANKDITNISYNYLNLPTQVTTSNGDISYVYTASGVKLKKIITQGQTTTSTSYSGNFIYHDTPTNGEVLKFFNQPEGYIQPDGNGAFVYVYQFKDHLGNVRLSYSDTNKDGAVDAGEIIEESNYYPFGLKHKGYNGNISVNSNDVAGKFKFNGIEQEKALGINLYEMTFRQYDAAIGRFTSIDPVTHFSMSTYTAFDNNPIFWSDPSGADSEGGYYGRYDLEWGGYMTHPGFSDYSDEGQSYGHFMFGGVAMVNDEVLVYVPKHEMKQNWSDDYGFIPDYLKEATTLGGSDDIRRDILNGLRKASNSSIGKGVNSTEVASLSVLYGSASAYGDYRLNKGTYKQLNGKTGTYTKINPKTGIAELIPEKNLSEWGKINQRYHKTLSKLGKYGNFATVAVGVVDLLDDGNIKASTVTNSTLLAVAVAFPVTAPFIAAYAIGDFFFNFSGKIDNTFGEIETGLYDD